jgi:hypothetical protein
LGIGDSRADTVVLIFSVLAVIVAGTLSMATISSNHTAESRQGGDPIKMADEAARAGIDAARRHVECHGRVEAGGLSPKYHINGATYSANWGEINLSDSTVAIRAIGNYSYNDKQYSVELDKVLKVNFQSAHRNVALDKYYTARN